MTTDETIAAAQSALAGKRLSVGTRLLGAADQPTNETPIGRYIDHTLLKPEATSAQIAQLCAEAHSHRFMSVCINPGFLREAAAALAGSGVRVCTVIGFPLGATSTEAKVAEAEQALRDGAHELDMVISIGRIKAGDYERASADIAAVVAASHAGGALCKVIIETALLSDEEKAIACLIAAQAGADFVKTSTGFSGGGATVADIALMRAVVGAEVGVKASGGVRSRSDAEAMIAAGATRIGTSAGIAIVAGQSAQRGTY